MKMCECKICGKNEYQAYLKPIIINNNEVDVCDICEFFVDDLKENEDFLSNITIKRNTPIRITKDCRKVLNETFKNMLYKYSIFLKDELLKLEGTTLIEKVLEESKRNNWDKTIGLNVWSLTYHKKKSNSTKGYTMKELRQAFYIIKQFEDMFNCEIYKNLKIDNKLK
jgi:hypothetical protein